MKLRHDKIHLFLISLILVANLIGFNPAAEASTASAGSLIKMNGVSSVYYLGDDDKRYVFPSETVYFSWYKDFNGVVTVPTTELQSYPLGGNIVMRAGTKLVKITTDPAVYAVEPGGLLRKIKNEAQAKSLFGDNWAKRVGDVPDSLFTDYSIGNELADNELPAGSLVKEAGAETYYYFDGSNYKKINSADAFLANRFYSEYIIQAKQALANQGASISDSSPELLALIKWKHLAGNGQANNGNVAVINPISGGGSSGGSSGGGGAGSSGGGGGGGSGSPILTCTGNTSQSCAIANGLGSQNRTCSNGVWSGWGQCSLVSCNASYQASGNTCVPITCSGSSTQSCVIANGQGAQTRTCSLGEWSAWGTCAAISCNNGYQISGNYCVASGNNLSQSFEQIRVHNQSFAIPSNAVNGDVVGELNVFWHNLKNLNVSYSILSGSNGFSIDASGVIRLVDSSVLSGQTSLSLNIQAQDQANQVYENATLTIAVLPAANTYFIDPSVAVSGSGTRTSPYKSWSNVSFAANRNYLQKRGSTDTVTARVNVALDNILLGAYGSDVNRPIILGWNLTGSSNGAMGLNGNNDTIRDLDIDAKLSTSGIYSGSGNNNTVDNCRIQNSEWGLRTMNAGPTGYKLLNSEVAYTGDDGLYSSNRNNLEIAHSYIHGNNQHWNENSYWYQGKTEQLAAGDGVQLNGTVFGFNIHHNIFDRSDTDNKFCVIVSPLSSTVPTNGLLEHNYCKLRPNANESGFYLFRGLVGVKVRYNTFVDDTGIYSHSPDLLIAYNQFINSRVYVGDNGASYKVYNNVFYSMSPGVHAVDLWTDNLDLKNNIFFFTNDTSTGLVTSSQHSILRDNNMYYPNFRGAGSSASNIIADPLFVDAANSNFRLQANSQAIGAGVSVGETHDFYGNALGSSINIGLSQ